MCLYATRASPDYRSLIKLRVLHDERTSTHELKAMLAEHGHECSTMLVSGVAHAFREDLRLLRRLGLMEEIDKASLTPLPRAPKKPSSHRTSFYYHE